MLANVTYDRTNRRYEVANGETVLTFPAGVDGRREAFKAAVELENPALYRLAAEMANDHPQLASRIWRAAEIHLTGRAVIQDSGVILVPSQSSEYGDYTVQTADRGLHTCDCQDFQGGTAVYIKDNDQPFCKHIIAYHFALVCE
jgi:hypothetical protein